MAMIFDTPSTKTLQRLIDSDDRITGLSIEYDGVFIYTCSAQWCDDAGSGTFRADSETAAIKRYKECVERNPYAKGLEREAEDMRNIIRDDIPYTTPGLQDLINRLVGRSKLAEDDKRLLRLARELAALHNHKNGRRGNMVDDHQNGRQS